MNKKLKTYLKILLATFIIILIFTFIDYLIHSLKEEYFVPSWYYTNKMIYGTLIGFITLSLLQKFKNIHIKTLIFSLVVSTLLQTRYALTGYDIYFVVLFLFIHFIILSPSTYLIIRLFKKLSNEDNL